MRNNNNYLDEILKEKLSDIKITPYTSWNDFSGRYTVISNVGKSNIFLTVLKNTKIKLYTLLIISGVFITGIFLFNEPPRDHYGKISGKPVMRAAVKISSPVNSDEFNKQNDSVLDDHVRIKVEIPIHKKVIVKKEVILRDSTHK